MLKKTVHILLALLLFIGSTGMTISKHYCGSSLASIGINYTPTNCCDIPMNCCHDELITYKIKDTFSGSFYSFEFDNTVVDIEVFAMLFDRKSEQTIIPLTTWESPPPPNIHEALSSLQSYLL